MLHLFRNKKNQHKNEVDIYIYIYNFEDSFHFSSFLKDHPELLT